MQIQQRVADVGVRVGDVFQRGGRLFGEAGVAVLDVAHHVAGGAEVRLFEHGVAVDRLELVHVGIQTALLLVDLLRLRAADARDGQPQVAGGQFGDLADAHDGADGADVVRGDLVLGGVLLHTDEQRHLPLGRARNGGERNDAPDVEGVDGIREDDLAAHGDEGVTDDLFG